MAVPRPGKPVRGPGTGRPIMALLDLLGRRWVLRIIYELRNGPLKFRVLQEQCEGMSPSVLSQRLKDLVEASIVEAGEDGSYGLTAPGKELRARLGPVVEWAADWAKGK